LVDWTIIEDNGFLKAMNLSALTFLLFPLLGILVPLIMWISKKDKVKNINTIGKNILNFQITWCLILFAGFILNSVILAKEFDSADVVLVASIISSQKRIIIFFLMMYAVNVMLIVVNNFKIEKSKNVFYYPKINFIRQ
jgi:uncharacterized Tic20 family protein